MKKLFAEICLAITLLTPLLATPVSAQLIDQGITSQQDQAFRTSAGYAPASRMSLTLLVAQIIRWILSMLGLVFVILIIYAGVLWMTSAGNEEKITKAKQIMSAAVVGLVIVLSAYAITFFVINQVLLATQGDRL